VQPDFCGAVETKLLWLPAEIGPNSIVACLSGDEASDPAWKVCTESITVVVVDAAALPPVAGAYAAAAGETLQTVGDKFGLPAVLIAAANPDLEPGAALEKDTPVKIPSSPAPDAPAPGSPGSSAAPRAFHAVEMTSPLPVDRVYCYYSLGENFWSRLPAAPQTFVYPLNGRLDLTPQFSSVTVPSVGGALALECWGWSGSSLVYLGSGDTALGSQTQAEVRGEKFAVTAMLAPIPVVPSTMGGTPPPTPPPGAKLMPPINLRRTGVLTECIDHFPPVFRELFGTLACKGAVETSQLILVWDRAIFPLEGYSNEIEGYKVYKTNSTGKLALMKTIPDPNQKILILSSDLITAPPPTFCVRSYFGALESTTTCYTVAPESMGLATVTISPVPFSEDGLSLHTAVLSDSMDLCGDFPYPYMSLDSGGAAIPVGEFFADGVNVASGFHWFYYEGDCPSMVLQLFSGDVRFKLESIKGPVSKAVLTYRQGKSLIAGVAAGVLPAGSSCAEWLNTVDSVSGGAVSASSKFASIGLSGYDGLTRTAVVTEAARNWMLGEPNLGFVLISRPQSGGAYDEPDQCVTSYSDFVLTVTYFVP
jgi:hypothetical protein